MKSLYYNVNPIGWATAWWMKRFWPGVLLSKINGLELRDVDSPKLPGDDWVVCRTLLGGICGTDLGILTQKQPPDSILQEFSTMPARLGHENVAIVEQVGPAVDKSWVGKRVVADPTLCCSVRGLEPCPRCEAGEYGACENFGDTSGGKYGIGPGTSMGYCGETGGAFSEYFPAHVSQLVEVPDELSDEMAILTDPLACSLHSVLRADLSKVKNVLVCGCGVLGLGVIATLRAVGFEGHIDAMNRSGNPEKLAREFGASDFFRPQRETEARFKQVAERTGAKVHRARFGNFMLSGGYDLVFDCVGSATVFTECLKFTAARGQVIMVATSSGGKIDLTPVWFRELDVKGIFGRQLEHFEGERIHTNSLVHKFMLEQKLNVGKMLTHTFRLEQYKQAFDAAINKSSSKAIKVAFDFRAS